MSNLNKIYHKGEYRFGEWGKHLRPYLKRQGNKKFRRTDINLDDEFVPKIQSRKKAKRIIEVKITSMFYGDIKVSKISKYRTMRDAQNAINRGNVVRAHFVNGGENLNSKQP
ncbi:MAG: hypothetical protein MK078_15145 [Crocinitomicaceae bacterium]|nr:hypothetical protein [Crocinitomicaceae bacterium]